MLYKGIFMASKLITTHELTGTRVLGGKKGTKRIGKIRRFVFHPKEKRVIGFVVKRPDLLWMFHRADVFVPIDGYDLVDGRVIIRPDAAASGKAYCKKEGLNWDDCVLWVGLPVMSEDGESYGIVGNVTFNRLTGTVDCFETDNGATSNALLGKRTIPADMVRGFKRGMGAALANMGAEGMEGEEVQLGAMLVSPQVADLNSEGGVAEKAGAATAVAVDKVQTPSTRRNPWSARRPRQPARRSTRARTLRASRSASPSTCSRISRQSTTRPWLLRMGRRPLPQARHLLRARPQAPRRRPPRKRRTCSPHLKTSTTRHETATKPESEVG